jgi:hypothetical protein
MITREVATEFECHKFSCFASDLGWRPGEWPRKVDTDLGNGQSLLILGMTGDGAIYRQALGCITVHVLND